MAFVSQHDVVVWLPCFLVMFCVAAEGSGRVLGRQKREWIIPPPKLKENFDYTGYEYIAKIHSDNDYSSKVTYSLTGPGADTFPINLFTVNSNTGLVKINGILDREQMASYNLLGVAKYIDGTRAENDIELRIEVLDVNDCAPVFEMHQIGYVNESSETGTSVMRVIATDADEPNTSHTKIYYSIVETSSSSRMFSINSQTGEVMVLRNTLDRETKDTYTVMIKGADMNGAPGGNSATGMVTIKVLDINDNIPTLEKETYVGSVMENTVDVVVMRIKAIDYDLEYTDNWVAVFSIVSGNEAGYFSITTDQKTNEGIITINKSLDYEELKVLKLGVTVSNKASYNFGHNSGMDLVHPRSYTITINVINVKEGPRFQPSVKVVTISEDHTTISINKVITNYAAIDSDTLKIATHVRYAKLKDIDNWLIIDENTGDIKLNKFPDRESKYLKNGTYYAEIICITIDMPSKTATGTIAIQVEDFNDHCPKLTATTQTMCYQDNVVYVTAVDEDEFPNSGPFEFSVIHENSKQKWIVESFNDTTSILRDHANLWPGHYQVIVEVKDQQGKACTDSQVLNVIVCTCQGATKSCVVREQSTTTFGAPGILLLLLGLLLLLLVPLLLLFCLCGGAAAVGDFKALPYEPKEQLISYHTEGQGEDKDILLLQAPAEVDCRIESGGGIISQKRGFCERMGGAAGAAGTMGYSAVTERNMTQYQDSYEADGRMDIDYFSRDMATEQGHFSKYGERAYDGLALSEEILEEYYSTKANHTALQSQMKDSLLIYDYEGDGSPVGSVGCCSLLDNEDDLEFLNDLGPKFRTLAGLCQGSAFETVDATHSVYSEKPAPPIRPSTSTHTHTHTHTHTDTIGDKDHASVNARTTSDAASESTIVTRERQVDQRGGSFSTAQGVHVQDNILIPNQTLLIQQQPTLYYASTPMYVVEPQSQMMLVTGGAPQSLGHVGHGLVQVGGLHNSQAVIIRESQVGVAGGMGGVSHGADRMVTGLAGHVIEAPGLSRGSISRSKQVLLVENGSPASSGVEASSGLVQTILQTRQGSSDQGLEVRGHGTQEIGQSLSMSLSSQDSSAESHEDFALKTTPMLHGSQRVVVKHKKTSVIEQNIETSTKA